MEARGGGEFQDNSIANIGGGDSPEDKNITMHRKNSLYARVLKTKLKRNTI